MRYGGEMLHYWASEVEHLKFYLPYIRAVGQEVKRLSWQQEGSIPDSP